MRYLIRRPLLVTLALAALAGCANDAPYTDCSPQMACGGDTRLCYSNTGPAPVSRSVRFCTARCTMASARSAECPGNAACVPLSGGPLVCVPLCTTTADCPFSNGACRALTELPGVTACNVAL